MSGITGIFRRDGKDVDPADIKRMNDKISHRGPDGSKVWCEGPVALGHQMLHTTPESLHETLPFEDDESGLVITADARIDNRKDLAPKLGIEDNEYVSDSYFILKAYEKWGEKCPEELLGDFAFAIWDKNKEQLFCARDHMGVKPFYYYLSKNSFYFATEIKSILIMPDVQYKLNELKAAIYLMGIYDERTLTFYEDIFRLPAASLIKLNPKSKIRKYWELDPHLKLKLNSDEEYVNNFKKIFTEAVNCRLRSCNPVGFTLSGGMDSSSVVSVAKNIQIKNNKNFPIYTFSHVFNDISESNEYYFISKITNSDEVVPIFHRADHKSLLDQIEKIFWHLDEPFLVPFLALRLHLFKQIQNKDIHVVLTGNAGDTTLSHGENYLKELALNFQWKKLIQETNYLSKRLNINKYELFKNKVIFRLVPNSGKKIYKLFNHRREEGDFILNNKELVNRLNLEKYWERYDKSAINPNTSKEFHYELITQGAHQYALEIIDRIAGGFSIEPRHPFFDKRLIEFCFALPADQKFSYGWDKMILRQAMNNILPKEIQWRRKKTGFENVFDKNFFVLEKDTIERLIYDKPFLLTGFIDQDDLQMMYKNYKKERSNLTDGLDVWKCVLLTLWMQQTKVMV